jgi:hypothetical protein
VKARSLLLAGSLVVASCGGGGGGGGSSGGAGGSLQFVSTTLSGQLPEGLAEDQTIAVTIDGQPAAIDRAAGTWLATRPFTVGEHRILIHVDDRLVVAQACVVTVDPR